ncbi:MULTISPECIES: polysaccharide biosynthesis protein [Acidiphilium]|uniref:O-antigen biosynthesis protein WbqV n=1 Tax=Acidiphilium rubrum TaxID=526 RepID=A0A8G2FDT0_ACIRU|nr:MULTISPECIES: nucleoside-diphosphate sugar epimerase/dehydratase [Acidiphilium]SIQ62519.1 O-antigen biosynthesis protein WbqV [Acidiphilium rubrum]
MIFGRSQFRIAVNFALDGLLAALAVIAAGWLANPAHPLPNPAALPLAGTAAIWLIGVPFGLARQHWRFTSLPDLTAIGAIAALAAILIILLLVGVGAPLPSASFPVLLVLTFALGLTAPRLLYRIARAPREIPDNDAERALLLGDGEGAELFLAALAREAKRRLLVVGLLSVSGRETGRRIHNVPILGTVAELDGVLDRLATADQVPSLLIVASGEIIGADLRAIMAAAEARGLRVARAPSPTALAPTLAGETSLRPIAIEDLLNRPQVALDREGMARLIQGQRVLITGAGGSIGSELVRQVAAFGPALLVLLDSSEFALWQIELEISESFPVLAREAIIADVRDRPRIEQVCARVRPELVFHAAALKHVPMVEANPLEGIATNALGTRNVADAARASGAALMVLISTDKAVNPSSVMGASKRLAEMYAQGLDVAARQRKSMKIVTVRFGNVLGSTGSVVPLFRRQLARGGPLTVTHPDMRRYFMTVREAVSLVLQASVVGASGAALPVDGGGIFVLDMGEPVKIVDLARQMIRLAGLRVDLDVAVQFTGLRPGEKLFEELFHGAEKPIETAFPGLLMAAPRVADAAIIGRALDEVGAIVDRGDAAAGIALLRRLIPEFSPDAAQARG